MFLFFKKKYNKIIKALPHKSIGKGSAGTPGGGGGGGKLICATIPGVTKRKNNIKKFLFISICMWTQQGLNLRPPDYESGALTN